MCISLTQMRQLLYLFVQPADYITPHRAATEKTHASHGALVHPLHQTALSCVTHYCVCSPHSHMW